MQQAAAQANRQAAARGLMNSSMAVGAAQGAQAQAALPLAQSAADQATSIYGTDVGANLSQQQINNQNSQFGQSLAQNQNQFNTTAGQNQQQITNQNTQFGQSLAQNQNQFNTTAGQNQQQINNQNAQFGVTAGQNQQQINNQNSQFQTTAQQNQQQISNQANQFQQSLAQTQADSAKQSAQFAQSIQANSRGAYTDAANTLLNNSSVNLNNIASNANLKQADKDKLVAQEISNRNTNLAALQQIYGATTSWADSL